MVTYVTFEVISSDKITTILRESLPKTYDIVLTKFHNRVRIHYYKCTTLQNIYLIMISGRDDTVLLKLGEEYNFPRGMPIILEMSESPASDLCVKSIYTYGFYPKFDNDSHAQTNDLSEFDAVDHMEVTKKYSGFLAGLFTFQIECKIYFFVTSKNATNTEYSQDAFRIFEQYDLDTIVHYLNSHNMYLYGEVMSLNNQTHGARVLKECVIITCIGHTHTYTPKYAEKITSFTKFENHVSINSVCRELSMSCDNIMIIDGHNDVIEFMNLLSTSRDFITDTSFTDICRKFCKHIIEGTITHVNVSGDILEGCVIFSNVKTFKYKFPKYVVRTMFLRSYMAGELRGTKNQEIERFLDHWVILADGKKYWRGWIVTAISKIGLVCPVSNVAQHIMIADSIDVKNVEPLATLESSIQGTIIIIVAPVGYGKSTLGNVIQQTNDIFVHIDADMLGMHSMKDVMRLGEERTPYTQYQLVNVLTQHKIPIISCGGGQLLTYKGRDGIFSIREIITRMTGLNVNIITFVPSNDNSFAILDKTNVTLENYNDESIVAKAVERRLSTGEWIADCPKKCIY